MRIMSEIILSTALLLYPVVSYCRAVDEIIVAQQEYPSYGATELSTWSTRRSGPSRAQMIPADMTAGEVSIAHNEKQLEWWIVGSTAIILILSSFADEDSRTRGSRF